MGSSFVDMIKHYFLKKKFTKIYVNNTFRGTESRSGGGSDLVQTAIISQKLPELLTEINAKSMMDAPCGDLYWISKIELPLQKYIGADIVSELIQINRGKYGNAQRSFIVLNIVDDDIPEVDVILCRDCLVHLSFTQAMSAIRNFKKSGSKYLLSTTFTDRKVNTDLGKRVWRPLNLELPPFNFPKPVKIINENCTEDDGQFADKSLALWLLEDIVPG